MHRFALREGWTTVFLVSLVVMISIWSIQRADWANGLGILSWVGIAGLAAGLAVSKNQRLPSWAAHLAAFIFGVAVVLFQMTSYLNDALGSRADKLRWLWGRGETWISTIWNGERNDDLYLFVLMVAALSFLLGYSSMWFVMRARWVWAALIFPGLLLFINLGYSLRVPRGYVVLFLFFAILLLVRFFMLERETLWRRMRIDYPRSLAWRSLWAATYLSIIVLIFGWAFPVSARSGSAHDVWLKIDGPWRSVESRLNGWFAGLNGPGNRGVGGFAAFSDSFDLGGPLQLSDDPVVLVTGEAVAPYLVAHRYSIYTGRGWESAYSVDENDPSQVDAPLPPQVELGTDEDAQVNDADLTDRQRRTYTMTMQRARGGIVFSPEVFRSSDIGVNLIVQWETVTDRVIDLTQPLAEQSLPTELQQIADLLMAADFTPPPPPSPTPTATAEEATSTVEAEATATPPVPPTATPEPTPQPPAPEPVAVTSELQALFGRDIVVTYAIDTETYAVTSLTYTGSFPQVDDVEAIYARDGLTSGASYDLAALESKALSENLRTAPTDAPDTIEARYLQLPDSVTPATLDLAQLIVQQAGATNQYDQSIALQNWLRTNVVYTEDVEFPPDGRDVVDYVLFETREGYCEYYASAFIVMARSLGLPARMATGFFPVERDPAAGGFLYRELNAHAWPEVYFSGYGWIPFEPTANRSEFVREPAPDSGGNSASNGGNVGAGVGGELPFDDPFAFGERPIDRESGGVGVANRTNEETSRLEWGIRGAILLAMLGTLIVAWLWLRGLRGLTPATQLYARVERGARWSGVRSNASMTPNEYSREVSRNVPGSRIPATYLADLYVRETWGAQPPTQSDVLQGRHAWRRLRGLLARRFFMRLRPWNGAGEAQDDDW